MPCMMMMYRVSGFNSCWAISRHSEDCKGRSVDRFTKYVWYGSGIPWKFKFAFNLNLMEWSPHYFWTWYASFDAVVGANTWYDSQGMNCNIRNIHQIRITMKNSYWNMPLVLFPSFFDNRFEDRYAATLSEIGDEISGDMTALGAL